MKKWIIFIPLVFISLIVSGQTTKADSLALELERQEIFEKVERHEELVKRIKWTSPWFLIPTVIAVLGFGWTVWLYFRGIQKKVETAIKSEESKILIKSQIDDYFKEKAQKEEQRKREEEKRLKGKPVYLIFHPEEKQQDLDDYLKKNGFTNVKTSSINDPIEPDTNDVIIFVNVATNELDSSAIENFGKKYERKAKFLYYGKRWEGKLKMNQFSNNKDTLIPRLLESLKA